MKIEPGLQLHPLHARGAGPFDGGTCDDDFGKAVMFTPGAWAKLSVKFDEFTGSALVLVHQRDPEEQAHRDEVAGWMHHRRTPHDPA